jgi:hypothetical protein
MPAHAFTRALPPLLRLQAGCDALAGDPVGWTQPQLSDEQRKAARKAEREAAAQAGVTVGEGCRHVSKCVSFRDIRGR